MILRFRAGIIDHSEKFGIEPRRAAMVRDVTRGRSDWDVSASKEGGDDRERDGNMSKRLFHALSTQYSL